MLRVLLLGAGKIGRTIAKLLTESGDYHVRVADVQAASLAELPSSAALETLELDAADEEQLRSALQETDAVVSALSYHFNVAVARQAQQAGCSYFDLTEDVQTTRQVRQIAADAARGQIFMPQCGLAPGFVSILARHLTRSFDELNSVYMRVGALPQFPTNALKYNLTWSTDGLINEYCNACEAIHQGRQMEVLPLEGLEHFSLDGVRYEAFNTSGGLGTLCETLDGKVQELNYKTIRYTGHRELAALLVNELRLRERRGVLKDILETAIPITYQDVVIVFCTVTGMRHGRFVQHSDARKIYHQRSGGEAWSAIQLTTAAGLCGVLDLFREGSLPRQGFVHQEDVPLDSFLANRFGRRYRAAEPVDISGAIDSDNHTGVTPDA